MRVFFLPIEPLPERYTEQQLRWVTQDLESGKHDYTIILPESDTAPRVSHGEFLDSFQSNAFKSRQLSAVATLFARDMVSEDSVFLLGDSWFPGIEQVRMMADLAGIRIRLAGFHHAGMFDPHDYWARTLGPWAREWERMAYRSVFDYANCGSMFMVDILTRKIPDMATRLTAFGQAWKPEEVKRYASAHRERIVVFAHRLAPEKQPEVFVELARKVGEDFPEWRWVISTPWPAPTAYIERYGDTVEFMHHNGQKESYYRLLGKARVLYSASLQETFGYSIHEAIACGCSVVAPYRCCYPETFLHDKTYLYADSDGESLLRWHLNEYLPPDYELTRRWERGTAQWLEYIEKTKPTLPIGQRGV